VSKQRRFKVDSLKDSKSGDLVALPPDEAHHAKVLRLSQMDSVEVFDESGLSATGLLESGSASVRLKSAPKRRDINAISELKITLAVAWPKGKRAAVLVQHCTEVGVSKIVPLKYARTVVSKDDESEGIQRLKRIAAEAAKQCGRTDVPEILPERKYAEALKDFAADSFTLVLDPRAPLHLLIALKQYRDTSAGKPVTLIVGPEGGFTDEELSAADDCGVQRVRMSQHVLRVETASFAALSITAAVLIG
jgi:16S rRNA (uracil1498-N3)-methyltransferase